MGLGSLGKFFKRLFTKVALPLAGGVGLAQGLGGALGGKGLGGLFGGGAGRGGGGRGGGGLLGGLGRGIGGIFGGGTPPIVGGGGGGGGLLGLVSKGGGSRGGGGLGGILGQAIPTFMDYQNAKKQEQAARDAAQRYNTQSPLRAQLESQLQSPLEQDEAYKAYLSSSEPAIQAGFDEDMRRSGMDFARRSGGGASMQSGAAIKSLMASNVAAQRARAEAEAQARQQAIARRQPMMQQLQGLDQSSYQAMNDLNQAQAQKRDVLSKGIFNFLNGSKYRNLYDPAIARLLGG